jgi:hypothetical protein
MPFLSFIVGFRNRDTERVRLFLESLKAINSDDYELIFVDYGSDETISKNVKNILSNYSFASYHFFNSRGQNWNRAKCLNYAYSISIGQYIFTSDIDFLYSQDFIEIVKGIVSPTKSFYFQVGFLTQKQSQVIHFDSTKYEIESYSNEDAVGALLISRNMFDEVGGYDEFYEIWGIEDNDLLYRLNMTNNQISFYNSKTIIWHIWHLPVKQSAVLPNGWLKLLKDYFDHKKQSITACNQNYYCKIDSARPVINNRLGTNFKTIKIDCSEKFLPIILKYELIKLKPNEGLCLTFNFSSFNEVSKSRLNKLVYRVNTIFKKFKSPLHLENTNMQGYLSQQVANDTLQFFLKNNSDLVLDSYIPNDIAKEPVYFIRK